MAAKITTEPFSSIPPHQRHSVTVHMPAWSTMVRFSDRDPEILGKITQMYPRIVLHKDVREVCSSLPIPPLLPQKPLKETSSFPKSSPSQNRQRKNKNKAVSSSQPPPQQKRVKPSLSHLNAGMIPYPKTNSLSELLYSRRILG